GDSQFMVNIMGGKGYLPLEIWAYSLALYAILKEEPEIIWPNALGREMRPLFDRCLGYLNSHDLPFSLKDFSSDGIPPDPLKRNLLDSSDKAKLLEIDHGLLTIHSNENLYRRAEQNFKLNLLLPASQDYFQLMQKETNNPRALSGIAKTLLRARQLSDCQGYLDKVFELDKHYEEARITQGHLHLLTYNLSSAIEILTPLPQTPLHASEGHHIMGMIAYEQGETPTAFVEMEAALSLRPTYAQLHLTIGIMHLDQRKFDQAENHIDQARELNPKLYVAYTYKGILLRKKNQFDSAISYLEKALEVNPYDEQAQWHLALTENRARCIEGNEWMEVYHFSDLVAALPIRRKLKKGGIKFKIRDENTINFTASTNIDKCILIREENVEKALDLIGSNILGWEEYAF
ncbi:MAG: tetratricopeptide repeat protein, partial [Bacteroidota bacterium]